MQAGDILFVVAAALAGYWLWRGFGPGRRPLYTFGVLAGRVLEGKSVSARMIGACGAMLLVASLAGALVRVWSSAVGRAAFAFDTPNGWVDLSPGAPEDAFAAAGSVADLARASGTVAAGYWTDGGQVALYHAEVVGFTWATTSQGVDATIEAACREAIVANASCSVASTDVMVVRGIPAGRFELELTADGLAATRILGVVLPGRFSHARVLYAAPAALFDSHRDEFLALVEGSRGVARSSEWPSAAYVPILALFGLTALQLLVARKR